MLRTIDLYKIPARSETLACGRLRSGSAPIVHPMDHGSDKTKQQDCMWSRLDLQAYLLQLRRVQRNPSIPRGKLLKTTNTLITFCIRRLRAPLSGRWVSAEPIWGRLWGRSSLGLKIVEQSTCCNFSYISFFRPRWCRSVQHSAMQRYFLLLPRQQQQACRLFLEGPGLL